MFSNIEIEDAQLQKWLSKIKGISMMPKNNSLEKEKCKKDNFEDHLQYIK